MVAETTFVWYWYWYRSGKLTLTAIWFIGRVNKIEVKIIIDVGQIKRRKLFLKCKYLLIRFLCTSILYIFILCRNAVYAVTTNENKTCKRLDSRLVVF